MHDFDNLRRGDIMDTEGQRARAFNVANAVLQTTTIDPQTYWAGAIVADQPPLGEGELRRTTIEVAFAGEHHRLSLLLAPEGTATPPQISLPAVTRADSELALYHRPATWLWDSPPPPRQLPSRRCGSPILRGDGT